MREVPYPHPGEILFEEFLKPMGITQYRLAKEIGVPQRRIGEIVAGTRGVTADTGLRLARFFGMSEAFWIGLQVDYEAAHTKDVLSKTLSKIRPWRVQGVVAQQRAPADGPRAARSGRR
jgi:addiction module HigA family antidote